MSRSRLTVLLGAMVTVVVAAACVPETPPATTTSTTTTASTTTTSTTTTTLPLTAAVDIDAGGTHTCVSLRDGTARCWGAGTWGKLGNNDRSGSSPTPIPVLGMSDSVGIDAGGNVSCSLSQPTSTGTQAHYCWGYNGYYQVKASTATWFGSPVLGPGYDIVDLAVAHRHTCFLFRNGSGGCKGSNTFGQLGGGTVGALNAQLATVRDLANAQSLSAGHSYTCAGITDGSVRCWPIGETLGAVPIGGITDAIAVSAGGLSGVGFGCAVRSSGAVACWGSGTSGQLGNGLNASSDTAVEVIDLAGATSVAAGSAHACALLEGGTVKCWGSNRYGQLGDGTTTNRNAPVQVPGLTGVKSLTAGYDHSCALVQDGSALCWGLNTSGQLGTGIASSVPVTSPTPTAAF